MTNEEYQEIAREQRRQQEEAEATRRKLWRGIPTEWDKWGDTTAGR